MNYQKLVFFKASKSFLDSGHQAISPGPQTMAKQTRQRRDDIPSDTIPQRLWMLQRIPFQNKKIIISSMSLLRRFGRDSSFHTFFTATSGKKTGS